LLSAIRSRGWTREPLGGFPDEVVVGEASLEDGVVQVWIESPWAAERMAVEFELEAL
jgi:hypothetical protein